MDILLKDIDHDEWTHEEPVTLVPDRPVTKLFAERRTGPTADEPRAEFRLGEEDFKRLIGSTDAIVALQDLEGRILYYHGPERLGVVPGDIVGKTPGDLLDPGSAAAVMVRVRHVATSGTSLTYEQRVPSKSGVLWFLTQISPVFDGTGRVTRVVTFARDITDRKQTEESLRRANVLLEKTFASLAEAVFVLQPSTGAIVTCNAAVERIFGYRKEEITGRTLEYLHADVETYLRFWDDMTGELEGERVFRAEFDNRRKDGSVVPTEYTVTAVTDEEGHRTGLVCVVREITEARRLAEELLRARKLESIGTLAGGIAHDFNNLLTAILGNLSMVKMHLKPIDKNYQRLDDAERACAHASSLTKKLVTFSNGGFPARRVSLTAGLLGEVVAQAMGDSGVAYALEVVPGLRTVCVDEDQMRQVITNIVENAIEAMPDGGTVRVRAENVTVGPRHRLSVAEGDCVRISIRDEGVGIPADHLSKIFDPYFTTKQLGSRKGTGLGLAVCYSVVKNHDGCIAVESEPGRGTTVHVYLPIH